MRIGLVTGSFLPVVGGLEWKVHYLASEYVRRGHEVVVFCAKPSLGVGTRLPVTPSYQVKRVGTWPLPGFGKIGLNSYLVRRSIVQFHLRYRLDVLHSHHLGLATHQAIGVRQRTRLPVIATTCGGDILTNTQIEYGVRRDPYYDRMVRRNLLLADCVGCVSSAIASVVRDLCPASKVIQIPNGVDWESFQTSGNTFLRRTLGLKEEDVIVVSVGSNSPVKNFRAALAAFACVAAQSPSSKYVIVGRGVPRLVDDVNRLGLQGRVHLLDEVRIEVVPLVLKSANIFLSTSLSEGFPQVAAQALASGLPCVLSNCSGNEDLGPCAGVRIFDVNNFQKAADLVLDLILSPESRIAAASHAHAYSHRYAWSEIGAKYLSIMNDVCRIEKSLRLDGRSY